MSDLLLTTVVPGVVRLRPASVATSWQHTTAPAAGHPMAVHRAVVPSWPCDARDHVVTTNGCGFDITSGRTTAERTRPGDLRDVT